MLFNPILDWIGDISSELLREKLSKEDSEARTSPTVKSCSRQYYKLSFSHSVHI